MPGHDVRVGPTNVNKSTQAYLPALDAASLRGDLIEAVSEAATRREACRTRWTGAGAHDLSQFTVLLLKHDLWLFSPWYSLCKYCNIHAKLLLYFSSCKSLARAFMPLADFTLLAPFVLLLIMLDATFVGSTQARTVLTKHGICALQFLNSLCASHAFNSD